MKLQTFKTSPEHSLCRKPDNASRSSFFLRIPGCLTCIMLMIYMLSLVWPGYSFCSREGILHANGFSIYILCCHVLFLLFIFKFQDTFGVLKKASKVWLLVLFSQREILFFQKRVQKKHDLRTRWLAVCKTYFFNIFS